MYNFHVSFWTSEPWTFFLQIVISLLAIPEITSFGHGIIRPKEFGLKDFYCICNTDEKQIDCYIHLKYGATELEYKGCCMK